MTITRKSKLVSLLADLRSGPFQPDGGWDNETRVVQNHLGGHRGDACIDTAKQRKAVKPAEVWTLTFKPEGDGPPAELRIRALLKRALRSHGLRCVDHRLAPPAATATPASPIVEASR